MSIKSVLEESVSELAIADREAKTISSEDQRIVELIRNGLKKSRIEAEVFVGGSFAKGTLVKGDFYDIDIFVRFDWRYEDLSAILGKVLAEVTKKNKLKLEKLHGSRDYFRIIKGNVIFEIVPVTKIKKPKEARNVTDLSYFHVNYVKRKLKGKLAGEVVLAKQFCKAQKVYGAESYINGFSGYALECLIINYKSFEKMIRELSKIKLGDRIVVDPANFYKKKNDVLFEMNESKLNSPIILVDPTWKERNALAALNLETFGRFQESARAFLRKPGKEFFIIRKFDEKSFRDKSRKNKSEFVKIEISTDRQPGDIAGTKLKKFASHLENEMIRYFQIIEKEFDYAGENKATLYLATKSKGELVRIGPPKDFEKHAAAFRKQNKNNIIFEKGGVLHARIKIKQTAKQLIKSFAKKFAKTIKAMGIVSIKAV